MKSVFKSVAVAVATLMVMSCEIYDRNINILTDQELKEYAGTLFRNHVLLPADMADFAVQLEGYLALTDEEKRLDDRFYGKIDILSDGVYRFIDKYVTCIVNTGEESIWDDGVQWTFEEYSSKSFANDYSNLKWNAWITDPITLTFNSDTVGDARLMVQAETESGSLLMALKSHERNVSAWNLSVQGIDIGCNGLKSEYGNVIGSGGINLEIEPKVDETGIYARSKYCEGTFYVDIYDDDVKIDWVVATVYKNGMFSCQSSR